MYVLDLHGRSHISVRNDIIREIERHWNANVDVIFVTGNSTAMKNIVIEILAEYKLNHIEGDPYNHGYIKTTV
ncbi:MAG: hypothetical protein WC979_02785 [Candidatus Pacearchaeota archaeon]|jgi:hypothetical protein|nr:hypothetical protein [Clostridia bacterium]